MSASSAASLIANHLASCLLPGTPPCYKSIIAARYIGSGRTRVATADLEMFDGQPATIEVFQWGMGFGHRWTSLPGGDASFMDGRWLRHSEVA